MGVCYKSDVLRPDIILGFVTVIMAVLGGVVSVHAPTKPSLKIAYGLAFVVLGCAALVFVIKQSRDAARAEGELNGKIGQLSGASAETLRLQGLNNDLQGRILDLASSNAALARQSIATVTGGSSFCYMDFTYDLGAYLPIFVHSGKYPIYDLHAQIVNVTNRGDT